MIRARGFVSRLAPIATALTTLAVAAPASAQSDETDTTAEVAPKAPVAKPKKPAVPMKPSAKAAPKPEATPEASTEDASALELAGAALAPEQKPADTTEVISTALPAEGQPNELPIRATDTPQEPLSLRGEPEGVSWGVKLGLMLAALGAGGLLFWRKRQGGGWQQKLYDLKVLGRTSVGMRSELLVVDADGKILLLGLTPSSISRLAELPADPSSAREVVTATVDASTTAPSSADETAASGAARVRALMDALPTARRNAQPLENERRSERAGARRESIGFREFFDREPDYDAAMPTERAAAPKFSEPADDRDDDYSELPPGRSERPHSRTANRSTGRRTLVEPEANDDNRRSTMRTRNRSGNAPSRAGSMEEQVRGLIRAGGRRA